MSVAARTILVVEGEPSVRGLLSDFFRLEGYRVLAATEEQALALAVEQRPDAILLDVGRRGRSTWLAVERLRGDGATAGIPLIAMTSDPWLAVSDAHQLDGLLTMPFDLISLLDHVERAIATTGSREMQGELVNAQ